MLTVIQSPKQICVNLLKLLHRSDLNAVKQGTHKKGVGLRLALPIGGIFTIGEPLYESRCLVVRHILG